MPTRPGQHNPPPPPHDHPHPHHEPKPKKHHKDVMDSLGRIEDALRKIEEKLS